jgi:hypothetical protein
MEIATQAESERAQAVHWSASLPMGGFALERSGANKAGHVELQLLVREAQPSDGHHAAGRSSNRPRAWQTCPCGTMMVLQLDRRQAQIPRSS